MATTVTSGSATTQASPLAASLKYVNTLNAYLKIELGAPEGDGWVAAADLAASSSPQRDEIMARIAAHYTTSNRHYIASTFFRAYIWQAIGGSIACYLTVQRVPHLSLDKIWLHIDTQGWIDTLALGAGRFAALPDDPAAGHPDVTVVADRDALRMYLLEQLTHHYLPPMIDTMRDCSPFGKRSLWAQAADQCAGTMIWLTKELGQTKQCRDEVEMLLCNAPLRGKTGILTVTHNGRNEMFLKRETCCQSYRLSKLGYCQTCPLQSVEERMRRLQELMAEQSAQESLA
jgi:ferric iron reductase protein FhuF